MIEKRHVRDMQAIRTVIAHLDREWIVEGCGDYAPKMGCASCRAMQIKDDLKMLACEIMENAGYDPKEVAEW